MVVETLHIPQVFPLDPARAPHSIVQCVQEAYKAVEHLYRSP
jgi:hypothetical protein